MIMMYYLYSVLDAITDNCNIKGLIFNHISGSLNVIPPCEFTHNAMQHDLND